MTCEEDVYIISGWFISAYYADKFCVLKTILSGLVIQIMAIQFIHCSDDNVFV